MMKWPLMFIIRESSLTLMSLLARKIVFSRLSFFERLEKSKLQYFNCHGDEVTATQIKLVSIEQASYLWITSTIQRMCYDEYRLRKSARSGIKRHFH